MDFGMENCSIFITVPPKNETTDIVTGDTENGATIQIRSFSQMAKKLDFRTLTWANKPKHGSLFFTLHIDYGKTSETPQFRCPSLSLQTFEVSCSSPESECQIDVTGTGSHASGQLFHEVFTTIS